MGSSWGSELLEVTGLITENPAIASLWSENILKHLPGVVSTRQLNPSNRIKTSGLNVHVAIMSQTSESDNCSATTRQGTV